MKSIRHYIKRAIEDPKRVLRKLDKIFLRGWGRKRIAAYEEKKLRKLEQYIAAHPEEYYDRQMADDLRKRPVLEERQFAVKDVLLAQFANGEAVFYDIAVRVLAIAQYYRKNTFGYDLYNRIMRTQKGYGDFWMTRFEKLIQSYEKGGLDDTNPIELDENLMLIDGAGRIAMALYHEEEFIQARVHKTTINRPWNYSLLWELNLSAEEIELVHKKAIELFEECKYQYVGVIWPSAYHLRDEIVKEIDTYLQSGQYSPLQNDNCRVVRYFDTTFKKLDFSGFVRAMYFADNMSENGLEWKNQIIFDCMPKDCEDYPVRVVYIDVHNPNIIRNDGNNSGRSLQITNLKKVIRSRFKDKVAHYEYDNVMHISDNYQQSKFCDMAVHMDRDLSDLFAQLNKQYEYALVKLEGRQSETFPKSIYFYTDADVLVAKADLKSVGEIVEKLLFEKYENLSEWVKIERIADDEEQIMIRVTLRGWMCFMIHVQTVAHFHMDEAFIKECMAHREVSKNTLVYVLSSKFEMLFRAAELTPLSHTHTHTHTARKPWHRQYIASHKNDYEEQLSDCAFGKSYGYLQEIKNTIASIVKEE